LNEDERGDIAIQNHTHDGQNSQRIGADNLSRKNLKVIRVTDDFVDDQIYNLPKATSGWGMVQAGDGEEYGFFSFTSAGVVTLISNSANCVATNGDGNLCIFDGGTFVSIQNRLGAVKKIKLEIKY